MSSKLVPHWSARMAARWITGPSASGSENGTPISSTVTPPSINASAAESVLLIPPSPAVK